jgi:hypothetical protein
LAALTIASTANSVMSPVAIVMRSGLSMPRVPSMRRGRAL